MRICGEEEIPEGTRSQGMTAVKRFKVKRNGELKYGVYISQLIRFARASSNLNDFNYRNKALTAKLLRQGYRYFQLRKAFSTFYRRHGALLEKYSVSLKTLLQQGISEPEFYGDLVYRLKKIVGKSNFSEQYRKL